MKKNTKKIATIVILLVILVATITVTFGKYVYNSVWNYYLKSKGFYFESDLLNIEIKNNSLLKWDGSNVYFTIKNSLNNKLISEYDITYKISCTVLGDQADYIDCNLNDMNTSIYTGNLSSEAKCINEKTQDDVSNLSKTECEVNGYTWHEEISSKDNYFNLVLKDVTKKIDEVSVKITAESLTPYHKTLSGIFNLNLLEETEEEIIKTYETYDISDVYTFINTSDTDKCLLINWNEKDYIFDINSTNVLESSLSNTNEVNEVFIKIPKKESISFEFYKINKNKTYSIEDVSMQQKECQK